MHAKPSQSEASDGNDDACSQSLITNEVTCSRYAFSGGPYPPEPPVYLPCNSHHSTSLMLTSDVGSLCVFRANNEPSDAVELHILR